MSAEQSTVRYEPGYVLSFALIGLLLALFCAGLISTTLPWWGIYLSAWGFMFLASYYYDHKSFFLRALMWVCEHFSRPRSRNMAFFYFGLCLLPSIFVILRAIGNL